MVDLGGKPLISYTIEAAKESGAFDAIIVTSDSDEVLELAKDLGCIAYERPEELATSRATVFDVCKDVIITISKWSLSVPDSFAVLLPTSPLRTAYDIHEAVKLFNGSEAECVLSACEFEYPPDWALSLSSDESLNWKATLIPSDYENIDTKRQDLHPQYKHDGSIIVCDTKEFFTEKIGIR